MNQIQEHRQSLRSDHTVRIQTRDKTIRAQNTDQVVRAQDTDATAKKPAVERTRARTRDIATVKDRFKSFQDVWHQKKDLRVLEIGTIKMTFTVHQGQLMYGFFTT